jgi:charged multivesicular body protein 5
MHRIFGKAKPKEPAPTLDDASASMDKRGAEVDGKTKQLDEELLRYKTQLSKMKPGPAKNQVQQRAVSRINCTQPQNSRLQNVNSRLCNASADGFFHVRFCCGFSRLAPLSEAEEDVREAA